MTDNSELKGLRDVKTAISTHARSTSRHKGTPYLEVLALGMEKLRLEAELARLAKRQGRVETRLEDIRQVMGDRLMQVQEGPGGHGGGVEAACVNPGTPRGRPFPLNRRSMTLEY